MFNLEEIKNCHLCNSELIPSLNDYDKVCKLCQLYSTNLCYISSKGNCQFGFFIDKTPHLLYYYNDDKYFNLNKLPLNILKYSTNSSLQFIKPEKKYILSKENLEKIYYKYLNLKSFI